MDPAMPGATTRASGTPADRGAEFSEHVWTGAVGFIRDESRSRRYASSAGILPALRLEAEATQRSIADRGRDRPEASIHAGSRRGHFSLAPDDPVRPIILFLVNLPLRSEDPQATARARQRFMLQVTVGILVASAVAVLLLPVPLPQPVRLAVVAIDLVAAAVIWLLGRQRYGR
jgi:hypothetical protein